MDAIETLCAVCKMVNYLYSNSAYCIISHNTFVNNYLHNRERYQNVHYRSELTVINNKNNNNKKLLQHWNSLGPLYSKFLCTGKPWLML